MQNQNEKIFKTSNRALAAFLQAKQIPVEIVPNPRRPNRVDFIAPATDTTYKAVLAFNQNEFIEIQTFRECLDEITDRMKDLYAHAQPRWSDNGETEKRRPGVLST